MREVYCMREVFSSLTCGYGCSHLYPCAELLFRAPLGDITPALHALLALLAPLALLPSRRQMLVEHVGCASYNHRPCGLHGEPFRVQE